MRLYLPTQSQVARLAIEDRLAHRLLLGRGQRLMFLRTRRRLTVDRLAQVTARRRTVSSQPLAVGLEPCL
jgi:hypothetical protein